MTAEPLTLLRRPDVARRTGLSGNRIDELERAGKFPKRVKISDRAIGWVSSEIDDYIKARIAERDAAATDIHECAQQFIARNDKQ